MKKLFFIFFICISFPLFCEYYSGNTENSARIIRVPIWVFLEGQPGTMNDEGSPFVPPKEALWEISKFLLSGMSYGWNFSYTPPDSMREVKEFFQIENIKTDDIENKYITIKEVRIKYPYVYSWAEYSLSKQHIARHSSWKVLKYKSAKGEGKGMRKDELEGVKHAYVEAIKKAVIAFSKKNIKNKPKEVIGEVLIKTSPRLSCASGFFKAEVELYINLKEVIPYTAY